MRARLKDPAGNNSRRWPGDRADLSVNALWSTGRSAGLGTGRGDSRPDCHAARGALPADSPGQTERVLLEW